MANFAVSNVAVAFVDLATFDELESNYLCGGKDRVTYFMRETRKTSWFSQIPVNLNKGSGQVAFGQEFSVTVSRSGDYLTHAWMRIELPTVQLDQSEWMWGGPSKVYSINVANGNLKHDKVFGDNMSVTGENIYKLLGPSARIRWSKNLAHNLIQKLYLSFNELNAVEMNNAWFDFWAEFMLPSEKKTNYNEMIGNTSRWNNPMEYYATNFAKDYERYRFGYAAPGGVLILPVPLPFSKDTGTSLPCAAIPYNEIRLHTVFRNWHDLLVVDYPYGRQYGSAGAPMLSNSRRTDSEQRLVQALYATWIGKLQYSPDIIRLKSTDLVRTSSAGNVAIADWIKAVNMAPTNATAGAAQSTILSEYKALSDAWDALLALGKPGNSITNTGFYVGGGTWTTSSTYTQKSVSNKQYPKIVPDNAQTNLSITQTSFSKYANSIDIIDALSSGSFKDTSCFKNRLSTSSGNLITFTDGSTSDSGVITVTSSSPAGSLFGTLKTQLATCPYLSFHGDGDANQFAVPVVLLVGISNEASYQLTYRVVSGAFTGDKTPTTTTTLANGSTSTVGSVISQSVGITARVAQSTNPAIIMNATAIMMSANAETYNKRDLIMRTSSFGTYNNITELVQQIKSDYLNEQLKSINGNVATAVAMQLTELNENIAGACLEDPSKLVYTGAPDGQKIDADGRLVDVSGVPFSKLTADDFHMLRNEACSWNGWAWIADYGLSDPPSIIKRFIDEFGETVSLSPSDVSKLAGGRAPEIVSANWWANYAIVHHSERQQMGKSSRDILIEQYQRHSSQQFNLANKLSVDIRFAHAVRALFFAIQNTTFQGDGSTYTAVTDKVDLVGVDRARTTFLQPIIDNVTLTYENTSRFGNMPSEYFTHVNPHWCSSKNNITPGLHMYSYSLDIRNPDPNGHTNFSRLNNVNLMIEASSVAQKANQVWRVEDPSYQDMYTEYRDTVSLKTGDAKKLGILPNYVVTRNTYTGVFYALSHTILRVSGGCVGFPLL